MTAQCAPYIAALKIFGIPWVCHSYFSQNFSWAFVLTDPVNVPTKFEVRSFTRSRDNRGYPKIWAVPGHAHTLYPPPPKKNPIYLPYRLFICVKIVHSFSRYFRLQFWVGVANSQSCGRGCRRGSEVVPFERALVSSCMPSIITFPSILRVSEILPLLFSRTPLFLTLPLISPKFPHVSLGAGGSPFRYKERRCWTNCLYN